MTFSDAARTRCLGFGLVLGATIVLLSGGGALAAKKRAGAASKATPEVRACIDAYKKAHAIAQTTHLRQAKDWSAACAKPVCPSIMRQECTNRYMQLDTDIPSVIPVVTDETGAPRVLVDVRMDGEMLTSKLDGHALPVDPGKHEFTFALDSGVFAKKKVMIVQGQRNRPISAVLHLGQADAVAAIAPESGPPEVTAAKTLPDGEPNQSELASEASESQTGRVETPPSEVSQVEDPEAAASRLGVKTTARKASKRAVTVPTYVLAGVAVLGAAGYGLLTYWGKKDNDALAADCGATQSCLQSSVDHVHKLYVAANISGGLGLVALATSAWLYHRSQTAGESPPPQTASTRSKRTASIRMLDLQPTPAGAVATIGGSF